MIDIRELTPNCHVMLGDKRVKVVNIDSLNNLIGVEDYYYVAQDGTKYCVGNEPKNIDPIPITEELLKELSQKRPIYNTYLESSYIVKWGLGNDYFVEVEKYDYDDYYTAEISQTDFDDVDETDKPIATLWKFKYLHELEQFVYLTCKTELISNN